MWMLEKPTTQLLTSLRLTLDPKSRHGSRFTESTVLGEDLGTTVCWWGHDLGIKTGSRVLDWRGKPEHTGL